MSQQLFRKEVFEARKAKAMGEVKNITSLPSWVFTIMAVSAAVMFFSFAFWGEYSRRERVEGYLALDTSAARVAVTEAGRITKLHVKEGDEIEAGDTIISMSIDRDLVVGKSAATVASNELTKRYDALEREIISTQALGKQLIEQNKQKVDNLVLEENNLISEEKLQQDRLKNSEATLNRYKELSKSKFVSEEALRQKYDDFTDQLIKSQNIKRSLAQVKREKQNSLLEESLIKLRTNNQVEQMKRQLSEIKENLALAESKKETLIKAPVAGVVSNLMVSAGQSVYAESQVANIIPRGSGLHAELMVPTRAVGFVKKGQKVIIRYEAFPYERFGQFGGTVQEVSKNIWMSGDRLGPFIIKEPLYRVDVALDSQSINSYGQELNLKPGMLLSADLIMEKRTVIEWIFEPLLKLKGRL